MEDRLVSKATLLATIVWGVAGGLMVSGWVVMLSDRDAWRWAAMLCSSALVVTGVAMVLQIRCYVLRILGLIRATSGLTELTTRELHSLP